MPPLGRRVPTMDEYLQYDGAHCRNLWRSLSEDWECPGCGRTRFQIMRWTKRYRDKDPKTGRSVDPYMGWMAALHEHHDHGVDDLPYLLQDRAERFPRTVICDHCNAADGRVKRLLKLPRDFSFSPEEIRQFVRVTPHAGHELDLARARDVYDDLELT